MRKYFFISLFICTSFNLFSLDSSSFSGEWNVETFQALQIIQLYTDGFDHFTNGYRIRDDFLDDPFRYTCFNFIDEDLLYITRSDGTTLRGFYQFKQNSGINHNDFPQYIFLEDKFANQYYFPVRQVEDDIFEINYNLELNLRNTLIQITCLARLSRKKQD